MSPTYVAPAAALGRNVALSDRYDLQEGRIFLSGMQSLVRVILDQRRADARSGLRTATLVSGYQGSPLGGFDREVARLGDRAREHSIVAQPAVNEELGATAIWGSQLAASLPSPRYDGVVGVWYGKAPGVDRAADAIRHGNFVGADPNGGVLALCGDDPASKSSTLPSASESLLAALRVPVFAPGTVQELLDLGLHAIACSRASGLWSALKVVTAVADATGTIEVGADRIRPIYPSTGPAFQHRPSAKLLAPEVLEMERAIAHVRLPLATEYARVNDLNPVLHDPPDARLGVIVSGVVHPQLVQALSALGLGEDPPMRILKVGMLFPLDGITVREFAAGLTDILIVEEKGPFLESLVKEALYGQAEPPRIAGNRDARGAALVPDTGALDVDGVAQAVATWLLDHDAFPSASSWLEQARASASRELPVVGASRAPYFCSGCPHNSSTVADDDVLVGAGIGCHAMVLLDPSRHGRVAGITQMGGEGAQWLGAAPFVAKHHFVQNLGDGTFHHSGCLAVRAAVAANLNITYKLLYNDAVAMTGGQAVEGLLGVPELCRLLEAEGVKRIIITTDDTSRYDHVALPQIAAVQPRTRLAPIQRDLARVDGVTVLIHDQRCAAELRRDRKRGQADEPPQEVMINERVCEGCGDCGEKSGCLSVEPVETEFGRKTKIHQASCNKDFSCLEGDCPSFLTIVRPKAAKAPIPEPPPVEAPRDVALCASDSVRIRLVGIGGTGVVTVSQVLGMAALLDGMHAAGLDQTGLSQKAGSVVSDIRLSHRDVSGGAPPPNGAADVVLAFDVIGAASERNLRAASPGRTVAVVSTSLVPTGKMVADPTARRPDIQAAIAAINQVTRASANFFVDAQELSQHLFSDHMPANLLLLGAAWQRGLIPVSREAIHDALRLNAVAARKDIAAFEWGRVAVASPSALSAPTGSDAAISTPAHVVKLLDSVSQTDDELRRIVALRATDLIAWGGEAACERYVAEVARVRGVEQKRLPGSTAIAEAFARGLYKLTAYKDEYEVARLHLDGLKDLPRGTKITLHLHPPFLRTLGLNRKIRFGRWFVPVLRFLHLGRHLRGTPLDPFGYARVRRVERTLPSEYVALVDLALRHLSPRTASLVLEVAALPEIVRGYESIKLASVGRFHDRASELVARLAVTA